MYQHFIFDLGGVIVNWKPKDFLMERFASVDIENRVYDIVFGSKEWSLLDQGKLSRAEGNRIMLANAKKQDCLFEVQEVLDNWNTILTPRRRVIELAQRLKKNGYHIYYLSNISEDTFESLCKNRFFPDFEGGVTSYDIGINKPDFGIYTALLNKYNLDPLECVFIDDMLVNVQAASELNISGIQLGGSVNALVRTLRKHGVKI